jgi:hypothetical protein
VPNCTNCKRNKPEAINNIQQSSSSSSSTTTTTLQMKDIITNWPLLSSDHHLSPFAVLPFIPKVVLSLQGGAYNMDPLNASSVDETTTTPVIAVDDQTILDCNDNSAQMKLLQQHYSPTYVFDSVHWKDHYHPNVTVYQVQDTQPQTFHGHEGVQTFWEQQRATLQEQPRHVEHMAVDHQHARVLWKAPSHVGVVYGSDCYTFDEKNRILSQTTVIMPATSANTLPNE